MGEFGIGQSDRRFIEQHQPRAAGRSARQIDQLVLARGQFAHLTQGQGLELPRYVEVSRSGPDHAPRFISEVRISGCKPARGEGNSKRAAELAAASALLMREGVWKGPADE